ncbi:hypothetical protein WAX74_18450 [Psychrobacillus sp. FJAT-51614]|uniref:Histidine kinase N-terminal 7TM region domain-containing protein n=2 Tax=Psychrobacillus mangrovi TaxID=3117745 RepID=A0ABU8F9C1_9BACI
MTVPSTWLAFVFAAILTAFILYAKFSKETANQFSDIIFLFIVVWKLSIVLTDFSTIIQHPWMLLYFSGERAGVYIGVVWVIFYMFYLLKKQKPFPLNKALIFTLITFYSTFTILVAILNKSSVTQISFTIFIVFLLIWILFKYKETIRVVILFFFIYCMLHLIFQNSLISTSMITATMFCAAILLREKLWKI